MSCCALLSCAAGTYPVNWSRRPLGMPAGEHRFVVALGTYKPGGGLTSDANYYWGITDQLQLQLPLILTYGGPVADNLEIRGRFGLSGFGSHTTQTSRYYRIDPRYAEAGTDEFVTQWLAGLLARTTLGEVAALVFGADCSMFIGAQLYSPGLLAHGVFMLDLAPRISVSLGVAAGLGTELPFGGENDQGFFLRLGNVAGSLDGRPTIAYHLFDQLDLVGFVSWGKGLEATEGVLRGTAGIDWHFD